MDGLDSLLNKNLLFQKDGPGGEPRLLILETIHEYAAGRLASGGEEREMRERHLRYFYSLAEKMEPGYRLWDQMRLLEQTEGEWSNLQAAFRWALDSGHILYKRQDSFLRLTIFCALKSILLMEIAESIDCYLKQKRFPKKGRLDYTWRQRD